MSENDMDMYELLEALEKQEKENIRAGCYQQAYLDDQCQKMLMKLEEQVEDLKATRNEWIPVSERDYNFESDGFDVVFGFRRPSDAAWVTTQDPSEIPYTHWFLLPAPPRGGSV